MRNTFVKTLIELTEQGLDTHLLTGDLGYGVLNPFMEKFPNRFTNMGVAEANMVGVSAGMALMGKRVFCYSMVPFVLFRTFDQVRSDLCYMNLPVTLVGVGGGVTYGLEGMTHHAIEDFALTRAVPGLSVLAPGDPLECAELVRSTAAQTGPCFLRLGANNDVLIHKPSDSIVRGRISELHREGTVAIIANGAMLPRAAKAREILLEEGVTSRLYSVHTIKPLDEEAISTIASECTTIVSVEEHSVINGLGTAIAEVLLGQKFRGKFAKMGLPDEYAHTLGDMNWMRDNYNLRPIDIARRIKSLVSAGRAV